MAEPQPLVYKNNSSSTVTLIGVGAVGAGKTVITNDEINHPDFELLSKSQAKRIVATEQAADQDTASETAGNGTGQELEE